MQDREAWHAAAHGVAKSWTQLERLNNNKSEKSSLEKVTRADHRKRIRSFKHGKSLLGRWTSNWKGAEAVR